MTTDRPRVAVAPEPSDVVLTAISAAGGTLVAADDDPDALVWVDPTDPDALRRTLTPSVRWVQLPFAGVESFAAAGVFSPGITWTCAKGVYSRPVAEHALALALAGLRRLPSRARATSWGEQDAATLYDAPVLVLGGGGITAALLELLEPFGARTTVVRRSAEPMPGAHRTVALDALDQVLPDALVVVLALALTPETEQIVGARQLELMHPQAWLVNVARGAHVDTDALVDALRRKQIGGAALDVTDPEPLPDGHPLWSLDNALVTPHTANPWQTAQPLLAARVRDNVRRFAEGRELLGLVDVDAGY
jgi:phosphoglycerate dehydrogenase-like enzyme